MLPWQPKLWLATSNLTTLTTWQGTGNWLVSFYHGIPNFGTQRATSILSTLTTLQGHNWPISCCLSNQPLDTWNHHDNM